MQNPAQLELSDITLLRQFIEKGFREGIYQDVETVRVTKLYEKICAVINRVTEHMAEVSTLGNQAPNT